MSNLTINSSYLSILFSSIICYRLSFCIFKAETFSQVRNAIHIILSILHVDF